MKKHPLIGAGLHITTLALVVIAGLVAGLFHSTPAGALLEEESAPATAGQYSASVAYRRAGSLPNCSGSLIHPSWVITASHCIDSTGVLNKEFVIGATDLNASTAEVRKVATNPDGTAIVVRHPEYVGGAGFRDIALVRLSQPSTKAPVSLADPARAEEKAIWAMDKPISVFGYGATCDEEGCKTSNTLRAGTAQVTQVPDDIASKSVVIARSDGDELICGGDSGGPMVARTADGSWRQFGITAQMKFGEEDTKCGTPAWGAAVGTTLLYNWVQSVIAPQTQFRGLVSGDFDTDGTADIIGAQANGSVSFFRGTGSPGTAKLASSVSLGSHWMRYDRVLSGDFDRDGKTDLIGRRHNGQLLFHRGTGSPGTARLAAGVQFNSGWQAFDTLIAGDFDRDGHDDIVARKPAGTLHFYRGVGTPGTAKIQGGAQFNSGWQIVDMLLAGDFDRDGHDDIVARKPAGTLHFYRGVGTPGTAKVQGGAQFNSGWQTFNTLLAGDFDRDGHDDIVARKPAGTLHFYRGVGTPGTAKIQGGAQFNSGWQIFA